MAEKGSVTRTKFENLRPCKDTILVYGMEFRERLSHGGIILIDDDMKSAGIRPRWAQVYAVGPEVTEFKVNDYIMISHGRWSRGQTIEDADGEKIIRKVDPKDILLHSNEKVDDYTFTDKEY